MKRVSLTAKAGLLLAPAILAASLAVALAVPAAQAAPRAADAGMSHLESLGISAAQAAHLIATGLNPADAKAVSHAIMSASSPGDPTGICASDTSYCWSQDGGFTGSSPTYLWGRDINGNPAQEYLVIYEGQAPSAHDDDCARFGNVGVYAFYDDNGNGYPIGAGYYSGGEYWAGESSNGSAAFWVWFSDGVLTNCTDGNDSGTWNLDFSGAYRQLYTANGSYGQDWQQIHV